MELCAGGRALKTTNKPVKGDATYERPAGDCDIHLLIFALDYKQTSNPLTCSMDGRNMEALARACGIEDLKAMYDEECTKENVLAAIAEMGQNVGEDDYFIIYYSGHGTNVEDEDGDEEDHQDEAFCFVDTMGQISYETLLSDDDFAEAVTEATDENARIIILTDCCHSGTIADLERDCWGDREVISITGCLDTETSGDMGKGGIFTHSLLLAVDQLTDAEQDDYSVGMLYNACLDNDEKIFHSAQNITIQSSAATTPDKMAWPLTPGPGYKAPLSQAANSTGSGAEGIPDIPPEMLSQLGLNPAVVQFVNTSGLESGKIDVQKLAMAGLTLYMSGACKQENCVLM